ncbi:MAG: SDR family oxidoreductase [Roseibium sp.]|uniref:SDR family oxidoreductase n=1 Tax=Roseibium sp. TaxID=1936156 RepID=UPI0026143251|nr:SDR family oxidoreductase [Roseibium sp.]MCV0426107.1 SDR family oxidoreductase [Roseibium sp.]
MIAVTGANGQLGRLALKHLVLLTEAPIRALVRSPEKAQDLATDQVNVVQADYNAPDSLKIALNGVERLLFISGSDVGNRVPQHAAVIDAAKKADVEFIVYTSLLNVPQSSLILAAEHIETEKLLDQSGLAHVSLRNGWYVENFAGKIAAALEHGAVVGASGAGKFSAAGREDFAEAAARTVAGTDTTTRALELGGQPGFTLAELAAELSRQTGRHIPFRNLTESDYAGVLASAGLPEGFAKALADADRGAEKGELYNSSTALEELIGHPAKSLGEVISETLAAN